MTIENSQSPTQKEFEVGGHNFVETEVQTPDGVALNIKVAEESTRRFMMTVESEGEPISLVIASSISLFNGDVSIKAENEVKKKHFESSMLMDKSWDDLDKGIYWQEDGDAELEEVDIGFAHGNIWIEPGEHGVLSRRSGQVVKGIMGAEVKMFNNEGHLVAATTKAVTARPKSGIVEIAIAEGEKTSKLIVCNRESPIA